MIDLGYDEGGACDILLVSLQFGQTSELQILREKWEARLGTIKYFHSKDYDNFSHGVFVSLSRPERKVLLDDLSTLIHEHVDLGITSRIDRVLYERITNQPFRSEWGSAYSFAAQMGLLVARTALEDWRLGNERVNILIESGHRNAAQVVEQLARLTEENEFLNVNEVSTASKKGNPILQSADMLAYGEWENMKGRASEVYDALHIDRGTYQAVWFDCSQELIEVSTHGIDALRQHRRDFWLKHKKGK